MEECRQLRRFNPLKSDCYYDLNKSLTEELTKIKKNFGKKRVLDIGAGEIPFLEYYKGLNVETADIQQNSQNTINHLIKAGEGLPFEDGSYDVIFIFDVLEHIADDKFFIKECSRILTERGVIVSNTPFMYRFHEEPYDYRRYTPSGLKYIFETVGGFKIKKITPIGSVFFSASKLILERDFKLSLFRRVVYRFVAILLLKFNIFKEVSMRNPLSYFVYVEKLK